MKKLFLLSFIIMPFINVLTAQTITDQIDNFTVEDKKVVWQKVFETDLDFKGLTDQIYKSGKINNPDIRDNMIIGKTYQFDTHFKEIGGSWGSTPIFLQHKISAHAIIEYKEGRYRVTLKEITTHMIGEVNVFASNNQTMLEDLVVKNKNHKFRPAFEKQIIKVLEHAFNKEFDFNKSIVAEDSGW